MAIKINNGYLCGYCRKFFTNPVDAEACKEHHNLVYVALSMEDLNRLVNFIYTKEEALLTETLINNLQRYLRGGFDLDLAKK